MKTLISFSAIISLFVVAPLTYMTFDTIPPYEFDVAGSYVIPQQTHAGHQITVHWKLARLNRTCSGSITRNIIDATTGVRIIYDPVPVIDGVAVGDSDFNRTFLLPVGITAGKKLYYSEGAYGCNLLQRYWKPLIVRTPTLPFEILAE